MNKKVRLKISTKTVNLDNQNEIFEEAVKRIDKNDTAAINKACDEAEEKATNSFDYSVIANYREENGKITITYREPKEVFSDVDGNITTCICCKNGLSDSWSIQREGEISSLFCFDSSRPMTISSYKAFGYEMQLGIETTSVHSLCGNGLGRLSAKYYMSQSGIRFQKMSVLIGVYADDTV